MKYSSVIISYSAFLIVTFASFSLSSKDCDTNYDCSSQQESQVCSLCVGDKGSSKCVYPFPDVYTSNETISKCENINHCPSNPCKNEGSCKMFAGRGYFCLCKKHYYGKDCELKHESEKQVYDKQTLLIFSIIGRLDIVNKITLKATYSSSMTYLVQTNEGYMSLFKEKKLAKDAETFMTYEASVVYPFEVFRSNDNKFLYNKNKVLGYITAIQISGYDTMTVEVFRTSFKIFVSYSKVKLDCMPVLQLQNCGPVQEKATPFSRATNIFLDVQKDVLPQGNLIKQLNYVEDCDVKYPPTIQLSWKVFKIRNPYGFTGRTNPVISRIFGRISSFMIRPFDLEFGLYWVTVEAKIVREDQKSLNNASCFFTIQSSPLEPVIEHGSKRVIVCREDLLVMSAVNSKDPNVDSSKSSFSQILTTRWSCTSDLPASVVTDICKPKELPRYEPFVIAPEKIPDKGKFNFTLEIWGDLYQNCFSSYCQEAKKHRFAYQEVVIDIKKNNGVFIDIECLDNCLGVVYTFKLLVLKAKIINIENSQKNITFKWTYSKTDSKENISWSGSHGTPSYIFNLHKNSLEPGIGYTVAVTAVVGRSQLSSEYSFKTDTITYSGTCEIKPEKGVKGQTYFDIYCSTSQELTFTFEFMDNASQDQKNGCILDGRMLGVSYNGILNRVFLTRGIVDICIRHHDFYTTKRLVINLEEKVGTSDLNGYIEQLHQYIIEDSSLTLQQISLIADLSTNQSCNNDIFDLLLKGIEYTPMRTAGSLKFHTSTLYNVLSKMHELDFQFTSNQMVATNRRIIYNLSVFFNKFKQMFLHSEIFTLTYIMFNCLILSEKVETKLPRNYLNNPDINLLYDLSESFVMVEETLENLKNVVTYVQLPGLNPTVIPSKNNSVVLWVLKDDPLYNYTLANMLESFEYIPVKMSVDLFAKLQRTLPWEGNYAFCAISMNDSYIHHWFGDDYLLTNLLYLSLEKTGKDLEMPTEKKSKITNIRSHIDLKMVVEGSLLNQTDSGVITQLDPRMGEEALDLQIKVYRFDPEPNSLITITFLYPSTNSSLRVLITKDYRPPYSMIITKHKIIHEQTPTISVSCLNPEYEAKPFYYMAFLPGPEIVVNKSVNYSFKINTTVCKSWSRAKWSSAGCLVGSETGSKQVHCQCTHFSIFGAISPYLPNEIDPFMDAKLFITVFDNFLVVGIVLVLFIVYLIILVWAYRADKIDQFSGAITVLEDNFPGDNNPYLLAVYTSSRFLAGTSANVGVQLEGERGLSRAHILKSPYYQVMNRNSDCWFLLFSTKPLGLLQKLHMWHDNSGLWPSWYCNEIHVYDLRENMETLFIVDQWLELNPKGYPEAVVLPATPSDVLSPRRLFFTNCASGIQAIESLGGVFTKHPRGNVTRFQLLNVAMCTVMVAMMCSIMFYNDKRPDDFSYRISNKDLVISVVTLVVLVFLNKILSWEFNKVYEVSYQRNVSSICLRGSSYEEYYYTQLKQSGVYRHKKGKRSMVLNTIKDFVHPASVTPATLANKKPVVKTRKVWIFIAWITCLIFLVVSMYITMLYGLKLGLVKSEKWLTSIFLTFAEDYFIKAPLSIVIIAILLTTYFDVLTTTTKYQVNQNDILNSAPQDRSKKSLGDLMERRSHPMYFPPSNHIRKKTTTNRERLEYCFNLIQFCITLLFIILIFHFVNELWSSQYFVNSHLAKFIVSSQFRKPGFIQAQNNSEVNRYIKTTFLQSLYSSRWYNNEPLSLNKSAEFEYWTSDFTWKLFGVPSLRQLRVKPESCKNIISANISCIPPWSSSAEDIDIYDEGWLPISYREGGKDHSPWRYTPPNCSRIYTLYRLYSPSGKIYDNGGFIAPLRDSAKESMDKVSELAAGSWLDHLTSVVFMELTLCHSNSPLLSKITLMTEYLVSSMKLKAINVFTVANCTPWNLWKLSFVVILLLFAVEFCLKINQRGLVCTLRKTSNVILMIIVLLGFTVFIMRFLQCLWYEFKEKRVLEMNRYYNFDKFISYYLFVGKLMSILLVASIFRVIGLFKAGRSLLIAYKTFCQTCETLMCLGIILLVYFLFTCLIFFQTNLLKWNNFMDIILQLRVIPFHRHVSNIEILIGFQKTIFLLAFSYVILTVFITCQTIVKTKIDNKK